MGSAFSQCVRGIMQLLGQIWSALFQTAFFGASFTFGDIYIGILFISIGFGLLHFFANHNDRGQGEGSGIKYD